MKAPINKSVVQIDEALSIKLILLTFEECDVPKEINSTKRTKYTQIRRQGG